MKKLVFVLSAALIVGACQSTPEAEESKEPEVEQSEVAEEVDLASFEKQGGAIAKAAFLELSGNLKAAMKEGGPAHAVDFCNVHALELTNRVADSLGVEIRRASMKNRNPENAPKQYEIAALEKFESTWANGEEPRGFAQEIDGKVRYFQPIMMQPACLNCHGEQGGEINENTWQIIQEKYPEDKAYGYALNQVRGMWSITFKDK
jgi:hypothetical protein